MKVTLHLLSALLLLGAASCATDSDSSKDTAAESGAAAEEGAEEAPEVLPAAPVAKDMGPWEAGDLIAPGRAGVKNIEILEVRGNGTGEVCGNGKRATLKYVAMMADGKVLDPGTRPFSFNVGKGEAIKGWDVIVAKMRVGDSFTLTIPQELAYGPSRGDLKFDMELLSFK